MANDEIRALAVATFDALDVLKFGEGKYPSGNFVNVAPRAHAEAAERHIRAWMMGQRLDAESGRPSLAHALVRVMFALALEHWRDEAMQKEAGEP